MGSGWEAIAEGHRSNATNVGVVAALVLSFVTGMVLELPEVVDVDDSWADSRESMLEAYGVFATASSSLCVACVILSIIWVHHSVAFVSTGDEFLEFVTRFPTVLVDICLILGVLCFGVAFCLGVVLVQANTAATTSLVITVVTFSAVILFYIWALIRGGAKSRRTVEPQIIIIQRILEETWVEFQKPDDTCVVTVLPSNHPAPAPTSQ